jgi:hypothetical protein
MVVENHLEINMLFKKKNLMWFILNNRAPTWEVLQKKKINGPSWCILCQQA